MSAPEGYSVVSGTKLVDSTGAPLSNAKIWFQPVTRSGAPTTFQPLDGGTTTSGKVYADVSGGSFSINLADTETTIPKIGYRVSITDNATSDQLLEGGYNYIEPTGATWSLDLFSPHINVPVTAPRAFVGSGRKHAMGLVPDPGPVAGTARFLREDGSWTMPPLPARSLPEFGTGLLFTPYVAAGKLVALPTIADDKTGELFDLFIGEDDRLASQSSSGSAGSPGIILLDQGDHGNGQAFRIFMADGELQNQPAFGSSGLAQLLLIQPLTGAPYKLYFSNGETITESLT